MKDSTLLKRARKSLEEHKTEFVCIAIKNVQDSFWGKVVSYFDGDDLNAQKDSLLAWVEKMLDGAYVLTEWYGGKYDICVFDDPNELDAKMHETRLAWLDWMIEYCEQEEADAIEAAYQLKVDAYAGRCIEYSLHG